MEELREPGTLCDSHSTCRLCLEVNHPVGLMTWGNLAYSFQSSLAANYTHLKVKPSICQGCWALFLQWSSDDKAHALPKRVEPKRTTLQQAYLHCLNPMLPKFLGASMLDPLPFYTHPCNSLPCRQFGRMSPGFLSWIISLFYLFRVSQFQMSDPLQDVARQ
jgi:hypothetical protein